MKNNEVLVMFTMDVEPAAKSDGRTSGPKNDAEGARNVLAYTDVLAGYGLKPTFFVHPELGATQAKLFRALKKRGAGLGLHLHAVKLAGLKCGCELGGLGREKQKKIIGRAAGMFAKYFGFSPRIFRPGCFSANDSTYSVLEELGFEGGSVCIPGRIWPGRFCVWAGADPYPRFAHSSFRQAAGDLNFVEIPLSVDRIGGLKEHALGFRYYADLRPGGVYRESEDSGRDHRLILRHIIRQLAADKPLLKTIVIDVHNDRNFTDLSTAPARQLRVVLDSLAPELAKINCRPVSAAFDEAIRIFRRLKHDAR
ncbi:MAG: polysaccharide deacetylase family protein [Kiritimatiellia bacterium]